MDIDDIIDLIINTALKIHRDLDPGFYTPSASPRLRANQSLEGKVLNSGLRRKDLSFS